MRATRCLTVGVVALFCAIARASPSSLTIDYEVRRLNEASEGHAITLRFKGSASGRSMTRIPGEWAGAEHAERGIERLVVVTPGARLEDTGEANIKEIVHQPGGPLTIRHVLRQIATGELDVGSPTTYLPILRPTYFEWIGWTSWIVPADDDVRTDLAVSTRLS